MNVAVLVTAMLVFARVGGLVAGLPLIATQGVPKSVAVMISALVTLLVLPGVPPIEPGGLGMLAMAVLGELLLGITMALSISAVFAAIAAASELMTMQIGLGLAMMLDPLQKAQNGTVGVLASWLSGTAFLGMGLHHECLLLVARSFAMVPPGSGVLPTAAAPYLMAAVGACIALGLQLAGPVLVLVWLVNCFVALLAKLAPRMNVFFSIGLTTTSIVGVALLAFSLPWIVTVHATAMAQAVRELERYILAVP